MTSRDFCFWLQGVFEVGGLTSLDATQTGMVKRHLALVFKHEIDPAIGGDATALQAVHDGASVTHMRPDERLRC